MAGDDIVVSNSKIMSNSLEEGNNCIAEERLDVTIAGNFVTEGIRESLEFWFRELSVNATISFAPLNQVIQYLLAPMGCIAGARKLSIILLQLERWSRRTNQTHCEDLAQNCEEFLEALQKAVLHGDGQLFQVVLCPASARLVCDEVVLAAESSVFRRAADLPGVDVVTSHEIRRLYPVEDYESQFDTYLDELAQIPYSRLCFATLGTMVARKLYSHRSRILKVIVVDCDNSLWSGVCGEVGPMNVVVGTGRRALQQFLITQVEGGRLLCLCSKNQEMDVLSVFDHHQEMLLTREHLTAWKINWRTKSENLRALSADLALNLDSFVFLDDDSFECAQVQALCPEVLTVRLPGNEAEIESALRNIWELDQSAATSEDQRRAMFYRQNTERLLMREETSSMEEFLNRLELEVEFEQLCEANLTRASQLTRRTNQFNLNGIRRSEAELRAAANEGNKRCCIVAARDRFGDYGTVGLMIGLLSKEELTVETLLLSCRALGRGIERRMMAKLAETASFAGVTRLEFEFRATLRNAPLRTFLGEIGVPEVRGRWGIDLSRLSGDVLAGTQLAAGCGRTASA